MIENILNYCFLVFFIVFIYGSIEVINKTEQGLSLFLFVRYMSTINLKSY